MKRVEFILAAVPLLVSVAGCGGDSDPPADVHGNFLGLWCGDAHLEGAVSGSSMDLTLEGTRSLSSGSCAFTVDAQLIATVEKDALSGSITYKPNTNSSADCAAVRTCTARMNLSGTRPPSAD